MKKGYISTIKDFIPDWVWGILFVVVLHVFLIGIPVIFMIISPEWLTNIVKKLFWVYYYCGGGVVAGFLIKTTNFLEFYETDNRESFQGLRIWGKFFSLKDKGISGRFCRSMVYCKKALNTKKKILFIIGAIIVGLFIVLPNEKMNIFWHLYLFGYGFCCGFLGILIEGKGDFPKKPVHRQNQ